ncbi:MAG TPA: ABC transporter substrate-binding protein [Gemmataceae bacterium]|nr:ABC transporter substrate-binding protein [Gemmataceae bacterium]
MNSRWGILVLLLALFARGAVAQATPPRLADLPKRAAAWPPAWAALARDVAAAPDDFETLALAGVDKLLKAAPTVDAYQRADMILAAALRHSLSVHRPAPLADNPRRMAQNALQERIAGVRQLWLELLGADAEALRLADTWLPATPDDSPLRRAIQQQWIGAAKQALAKDDFKSARGWLDRLETHFDDARNEPIRKALHERAVRLLKEAQGQSGAQAVRRLEETLELWPRLPEARDALERQKGTYRTLVVGVPALPAQLSPATAWTEVEKQTLPLLFDALFQPEILPAIGRRYRPDLAAALPLDSGPTSSLPLRRDVFWASGERVTAADVRHTALLMNKDDSTNRTGLWREFLDIPRPGTRFHADITRRQGLLDPLAPLTFWVLPQYYRGQELQRQDDADFAKAPVGSGPFQFVGRKLDAGKPYLHFQANPHDLRGGVRHLREIRMVAWSDAKKGLPTPLPELLLDAPTDQLPALKERGYTEVRLPGDSPVTFLAVNQRKPGLKTALVRRALALALDRQALVRRHFGAQRHATANGLFPRGSWASCPVPRVPAELYQRDLARSLARQAKAENAQFDWTLKYPAGDERVRGACEEMASALAALFGEAGIKTSVKTVGLAPAALRQALAERDYDLLYLSAEHLDDPLQLALLFDPSPEAARAGGSNYLGCEDVRLQELLQAALRHREFPLAQAAMHAVHVHLNDHMPAIPLWQIEVHALARAPLTAPQVSSRQLFSRIRDWNF